MTIQGRVVRGVHKAQTYYGLPTANLELGTTPDLKFGVYVGTASVDGDASEYPCLICYGAGFTGGHPKFEVHLFGGQLDLYDKKLRVDVGEWVSDLVPFRGEHEMKKKIEEDVRLAKQLLGIT